MRLLGEPPGKRGGLKANVRDGDRFPKGRLAHRSDSRDSLRSAPVRVNDCAIVVDVEAGSIRVRITDSGPGVPDGRAGEIFEPFFTTKPDGTGLGLAISQAIARAHGGDLTYAREVGVTRLELTLPEGDWRRDAEVAPALAGGVG